MPSFLLFLPFSPQLIIKLLNGTERFRWKQKFTSLLLWCLQHDPKMSAVEVVYSLPKNLYVCERESNYVRIAPSFPGGRTVVLSDSCFLAFAFNLVTCLESIPYQYMYICFILFDSCIIFWGVLVPSFLWPVPGFLKENSWVKQKFKKTNEYSISSCLVLHILLPFGSVYTHQAASGPYHCPPPSRGLCGAGSQGCLYQPHRLVCGSQTALWEPRGWQERSRGSLGIREARGCLQTPCLLQPEPLCFGPFRMLVTRWFGAAEMYCGICIFFPHSFALFSFLIFQYW